MTPECYPMEMLPQLSRLYRDFLSWQEADTASAALAEWFGAVPNRQAWMSKPVPALVPEHAGVLADALEQQAQTFGSGPATLVNITKLRHGAKAVVTGQQVGLFGGPLLTLLKAATAIARAREAERLTGTPHVPVFWLASEDHDLAEVDQVTLPAKRELEVLRLGLASHGGPVGAAVLPENVESTLDRVGDLVNWAPICDLLRSCYTAGSTLAEAFGRWMAQLFSADGLIVMDAAGRTFHGLGRTVLQAALERAGELEEALLARSAQLESAGYHAQVLVKPGASLLFLLEAETGARLPLRRLPDGSWKAGQRGYSLEELLGILKQSPERLSPNALLRPVFQDTILPTAAYIGGPAEIAYFAQTEVLFSRLLGRVTPVLPRLSATLVTPALRAVLAQHELSVPDLWAAETAEAVTQKLGARAMPIEGKRRLAALGNAMDAEWTALMDYLTTMDASLGRSAETSGNKMRYQMNRLRRMAANFQVQKEASLRRHAEALMLHLYPEGHLQERVLAGVWFLAQAGESLPTRLVEAAGEGCTGHLVLEL